MKLLKELEKSNSKEEKVHILLQKQILYKKAKLDLLSGKLKGLAEACRVYEGLQRTTLH